MVHALNEIHRVLTPDGVLIDLRPLCGHWDIEVFSARETRETGTMTDLPRGIEDDEAANRAMAAAESNGWFQREKETLFRIHYVWDTASEMEEWVDDEWENMNSLDPAARQATRSAWALGDADSQVRVKVKMLIARWKKL